MFKKISIKMSVLCLLLLTATAYAGTKFDFDGDGKADIGVFRPSNGVWYIQKSRDGFSATQFGMNKDKIVPADYDGDGKTDLAVHRHTFTEVGAETDSIWYVLKSSDNTAFGRAWGRAGVGSGYDLAVPADFDGDRKADLSVIRQSDVANAPGDFRILQSATDAATVKRWGYAYDRQVLADYDGDGKDDLAVFREFSFFVNDTRGVWYIWQSSNGQMKAEQFGFPTDRSVPADYDGDGRADIAVWRPSTGIWYIRNSRDNSISSVQFGAAEDKPVPADYDGDGKTDIGVFRPSNSTWYLLRSKEGFAAQQFGQAGDIPVENAYVR